MTVPELTQQLFDAKNIVCATDLRQGRSSKSPSKFRGRMSTKDVEELMLVEESQSSSCIFGYLPNNSKAGVWNIVPKEFGNNVCVLR